MFYSSANEQQAASVGRRNRLPTEPCSYSGADIASDNLLPNSNSPIKSPPYSSAESDDNSFKGTGNSTYLIHNSFECQTCKKLNDFKDNY